MSPNLLDIFNSMHLCSTQQFTEQKHDRAIRDPRSEQVSARRLKSRVAGANHYGPGPKGKGG